MDWLLHPARCSEAAFSFSVPQYQEIMQTFNCDYPMQAFIEAADSMGLGIDFWYWPIITSVSDNLPTIVNLQQCQWFMINVIPLTYNTCYAGCMVASLAIYWSTSSNSSCDGIMCITCYIVESSRDWPFESRLCTHTSSQDCAALSSS